MPEPITIGIALAIGAGWRIRSDRKAGIDNKKRRKAKQDKRSDRVLPASWDQLAKIDGLAQLVASRDEREVDHVLVDYGVFSYNMGRTRTMTRKELTRKEADDIARKIKRKEGVSSAVPGEDDRDRFKRESDVLEPRDDEEAF